MQALRPGAGLADFRKLLEKYSRLEAIMVVGHNPNLSQFLGALISDSGCEASLELKKGAVAKVEMRRTSGTLQWCVTPKVLANPLRDRRRKFAAEYLAEVVRFFFNRPQVPDPLPCVGAGPAST